MSYRRELPLLPGNPHYPSDALALAEATVGVVGEITPELVQNAAVPVGPKP